MYHGVNENVSRYICNPVQSEKEQDAESWLDAIGKASPRSMSEACVETCQFY